MNRKTRCRLFPFTCNTVSSQVDSWQEIKLSVACFSNKWNGCRIIIFTKSHACPRKTLHFFFFLGMSQLLLKLTLAS